MRASGLPGARSMLPHGAHNRPAAKSVDRSSGRRVNGRMGDTSRDRRRGSGLAVDGCGRTAIVDDAVRLPLTRRPAPCTSGGRHARPISPTSCAAPGLAVDEVDGWQHAGPQRRLAFRQEGPGRRSSCTTPPRRRQGTVQRDVNEHDVRVLRCDRWPTCTSTAAAGGG